jgi:hypothetical protein
LRGRKLTRSEALEEYLVYQIRIFEFLQLHQMVSEIAEGKYSPTNLIGHSPDDFQRTLRNLTFGLFDSLMDRQKDAIDVFDVWMQLFPAREAEIRNTWTVIQPHMEVVHSFRNKVAFHANKKLACYLDTRRSLNEKRTEIWGAIQAFVTLAVKLFRDQPIALPDLAAEIEPILRKALGNPTGEQLEAAKDYFVSNESS